MIQAIELVKRFGETTALRAMNASVEEGSVYGLVGTNGSGKSTFLRLLAGVYYPDGGRVRIGGEDTYENEKLKDSLFFVPDELYFFPQSTMEDMAHFYAGQYSGWDWEYYKKLCGIFPIGNKVRLNTFSKGMQRQAAILLALSARCKYLLLDEAFDGLDPVMRGAVRRLLADEVAERKMTVIISSHNLRELEDLCDHVGLLYNGNILFSRELDEVKLGFCKVQAAFQPEREVTELTGIQVMQYEKRGSLLSMVVRGNSQEVLKRLEEFRPVFAEALPLTLEEVFIHEMEEVGYDYNNIIF
ncbi:MAG: ABC transporter ATP-binding protein [Oscillospiraceae bacterium]|jgi:ABC-2 type transport system ATP-binding protein|nr:ABC transporter ATP-binding protein [Oscillospiraceae bacterium]